MIAFDDVHCGRGTVSVLRGVTLDVAAGETLGLVGRSGTGKSTVLKLINRILEPGRGHVRVNGRDTREWDPIALRRQAGYMLQEVGLFPHLSVARNIGIVPELSGWQPSRIQARTSELLGLVGLSPDEYASRWPEELSGGERQRVGVARALAVDPPILLMDEPFGALDPVTRTEMHREFRRIQMRVKKTVVIVTHDMREAFALADRVGVLHDGTLVECAPPDVLEGSSHPAVRVLLDAAFAPR